MAALIKDLHDMFNGPQDPRTIGWTMTNPWPLLTITILYLAFVLKIGPKYMEKRPAYDLKTFTTVYNIIQILGCVYMFYGYIAYGDLGLFQCTEYQSSFDEKPHKLATVMWVYAWFKVIEYIETVVFVLRKKQNQVSSLHVYHHTSTLFFAWLVLRFKAGGIGGFIQAANSFIHIIMYSYYLVSIYLPPDWQKKVMKYKQNLTTMQMIQFCLMLFNSTQAFYVDKCLSYRPIVTLFVPNIILVFYMFYRFFVNSYKNKSKSKSS